MTINAVQQVNHMGLEIAASKMVPFQPYSSHPLIKKKKLCACDTKLTWLASSHWNSLFARL